MNDFNRADTDYGSERLAASARDLAAHAEELLQSTASISNEGIAVLRQKLTESLRTAREQINAAQGYALARGKQAVTVTDTYVREKPWQAVAVAALFGVVVGFMGSGSRR